MKCSSVSHDTDYLVMLIALIFILSSDLKTDKVENFISLLEGFFFLSTSLVATLLLKTNGDKGREES